PSSSVTRPTSSHRSSKPPPFPFPKPNRKVEKTLLIKHGTTPSIQQVSNEHNPQLSRQHSVELRANTHSENQQFLKEIVSSVLEGQGIGWLKISRVNKLMEDENYRNFVLSRLNTNLDRKFSDEDDHIEDVRVSRAVFKGMANILKSVVQGLEVTFENYSYSNSGMASGFQLLEIAHTHYWLKDLNRAELSPMSERNSPIGGSRENLSVSEPAAVAQSGSNNNNTNDVLLQSTTQSITPQSNSTTAGIVAQLGSLWRESKLALARSYISATQPSSIVELRTNPRHSFSPREPFYISVSVSPSSTTLQNINNVNLAINNNNNNTTTATRYTNNSNYPESPSSPHNEHLSTTSMLKQANTYSPTIDTITKTPDGDSTEQPHSNSNNEQQQNVTKELKSNDLNVDNLSNQTRPDSLSLINSIKNIEIDENSKPTSKTRITFRRQSKINHHLIRVSNQWESNDQHNKLKSRRSSSASSAKSALSAGYRFRNGSIMQVADVQPAVSSDKQYLFEILVRSSRSHLWDQMQFWEDVFLDAVAQERDIIGLDQGPAEMMERYNSLANPERKRLELDEDRLLAVMLYNLIAFMIMMRVGKEEVRRKIRRTLGRCHIGLAMSQQVNELLDNIHNLNGNDVDLRPSGSRLLQKQSFTVHWGVDNTGDMLFMEVWDDCIILRSVLGEVYDRCWFEKLVNMTFCPKTKVLCLWRKVDGETQLNKFYTKRCRDLYFSIKEAMEKAASRITGGLPGQELGGEFPIKDLNTGEGGLLQVCLEGICLVFENDKEFIELQKIRKCTTQKGDIFVLEEFGNNRVV
ncbi:unnamed protein product, partial [Didymodactylos carnosus]